ncbi:hypothetical protein [Microbulbifer thermotolerans]|uniref:hypothetical protein n=1 Tax=Microbulbifer thermotolerans TaxID=252514 RepID=UPI0008E90B66|nr:hypothetical protein [Microbulbifer thermotolerans]MCX2780652.1 hypothetical protein [Microbulbifer thermotolerans]MCX2806193.1 hypothetical protein [Microbulbifer thermotolerans]SFD04462.1 hypothetical protein SAMN05660479_03023 [Microbulbifer thermotolerans]
MKKILLFLSVMSANSACAFNIDEIDKECSKGLIDEMLSCYQSYNDELDELIKEKIEDAKVNYENPKLAIDTQPLWESYINKWCSGRNRLSGGWGQLVYYNCMVDHKIMRLEQLNKYYCTDNGCGKKI